MLLPVLVVTTTIPAVKHTRTNVLDVTWGMVQPAMVTHAVRAVILRGMVREKCTVIIIGK